MDNIFKRYPELNCCENDIEKGLNLIIETYKNNGKVLVCGNGGSAADSEHIVGELMKSFLSEIRTEVQISFGSRVLRSVRRPSTSKTQEILL